MVGPWQAYAARIEHFLCRLWATHVSRGPHQVRGIFLPCVKPVSKVRGIIRALDTSDERNPDHPNLKGNWLEVARALGRVMADHDWDRMHRERGSDGEVENSGGIRALLKRSPKGSLG